MIKTYFVYKQRFEIDISQVDNKNGFVINGSAD